MTPGFPALGPRTMCSESMVASNPASSASTAMRTIVRKSRGSVMVQFSLRTRTIRGATAPCALVALELLVDDVVDMPHSERGTLNSRPSPGAGVTTNDDVDLLDHDLFADHEPWEVFDALQRDAPVFFHSEPEGRGFWALTKYEDVLAVLKDTKTFSSELGGAATIEDLPEDVLAARRNFLEFDPPKHGKYRRLLAADFTPKAVGRYEEWLRRVVRHRLESTLARAEFDLVEELAAPIPIRVLGHILGLPDEELPRLVLLGDRLIADTEPELVGDLAYRGEQPEDRYKPFGSPWADELCSLGRAHYADRRECPRDDVLTLISNGEIDGQPLSERDLDILVP